MKTESDLASQMASLLNPKKASLQSVEEALQSLDKAAAISDSLGMHLVSEATTEVIEKIPQSLKESK